MASTIRTEIGIELPRGCPVAQASAETGKPINRISRSATASDGEISEEFVIESQEAVDRPESDPVFKFGSKSVYHFTREQDTECACECVEQYGFPISDLNAYDGTLVISFFAPDVESVQEIVNDLNGQFKDVQLRQLVREDEQRAHDYVLFDQSRLTEKQREVLETSYRMGYFENPRRSNAGEIAAELGIAASTFTEHLVAAQQKLLDTLI